MRTPEDTPTAARARRAAIAAGPGACWIALGAALGGRELRSPAPDPAAA